MDNLGVFLVFAFTFSISLTFFIGKLALSKNIIDNPNERSSHTIPTPRGGGLAIVLVWFTGLIYMFWQGQIEKSLFYALMSGIILAIVSAFDDVLDLTPKVRMAAQAISAFGALYFLGGFHFIPNYNNPFVFWILSFGAFIGIIWFINLYNFLDGIDAYASQEAIIVAAGLLLFTGNTILGLLIASVAGFLVWNWPKAKIFMGDVGSTQLGFVLIVFGIYFHNNLDLSIYNWLILTALFWFDATYTLFNRWRNKEQLSKAHRKHAYQRLTRAGWSHLKVDLHAIVINLALIGIAFFNKQFMKFEIIGLVIAILFLFIVNRRVNKIFPYPKD